MSRTGGKRGEKAVRRRRKGWTVVGRGCPSTKVLPKPVCGVCGCLFGSVRVDEVPTKEAKQVSVSHRSASHSAALLTALGPCYAPSTQYRPLPAPFAITLARSTPHHLAQLPTPSKCVLVLLGAWEHWERAGHALEMVAGLSAAVECVGVECRSNRRGGGGDSARIDVDAAEQDE